MAYTPERDFLVEVAKGNITGHSLVHKFGRNDAIPNASWELISLVSGAPAFLSAADTVRIKVGGNAADTIAGAGAQQVTVVGVDSNLVELSEVINTAGASASSSTTANFWRVYRAYVSASGAYGANNTGDIIIEDTSATGDMLKIAAGEGQSQHGAFSVATATTAYLLSVYISIDTTQAADVRMFARENFNTTSTPFGAPQLKIFWDGVSGPIGFRPRSPLKFDALTDIWFEAQGSGGATEVAVDFEMLIVDD